MTAYQIVALEDEPRDCPPRKLYRRFRQRSHAEAFIAGEILFRSLKYYRNVEDEARQDSHEGSRSWNAAGMRIEIMGKDGDYGAPVDLTSGECKVELTHAQHYLVSCFSVRRNIHQKKFGPWLVTISHADTLIRHMRHAFPHPRCLFWGRVNYYDDRTSWRRPGDHQQLWKQKPASFERENEFRLGCVVFGPGASSGTVARIAGADLSHVTELAFDP